MSEMTIINITEGDINTLNDKIKLVKYAFGKVKVTPIITEFNLSEGSRISSSKITIDSDYPYYIIESIYSYIRNNYRTYKNELIKGGWFKPDYINYIELTFEEKECMINDILKMIDKIKQEYYNSKISIRISKSEVDELIETYKNNRMK